MQIEIEDDRIINTFKKYKNAIYKITPLGLLFPATFTNDTNLIFLTAKELNCVKKKNTLNNKAYNLLANIYLNRMNNLSEVNVQYVWTSVAFKDHKEVNNNSHLCFPFATKTWNDLTSYSIFLQDDRNKKIDFKSGDKKISIFNFQIVIFIT